MVLFIPTIHIPMDPVKAQKLKDYRIRNKDKIRERNKRTSKTEAFKRAKKRYYRKTYLTKRKNVSTIVST
jgi:polysaccharide deacetylase 2 family uncharacterized protein YibQ